MGNNRGYKNSATDTVRCQLMHDNKDKPFVQGKSLEEIKKYYFANEKEIKGGSIYNGELIDWNEVYLYCLFGCKNLFKDNFDDLVKVVEMEDKFGLPIINWSRKSDTLSSFTYEDITVYREFRCEWGGKTYWIYVKDKNNVIIDGVEICTHGDNVTFFEEAQFLILKALYNGK